MAGIQHGKLLARTLLCRWITFECTPCKIKFPKFILLVHEVVERGNKAYRHSLALHYKLLGILRLLSLKNFLDVLQGEQNKFVNRREANILLPYRKCCLFLFTLQDYFCYVMKLYKFQ